MEKQNEKYFIDKDLQNKLKKTSWWARVALPSYVDTWNLTEEFDAQAQISSYKNALLVDQIHEVHMNLWEARFLLKSTNYNSFSQLQEPEHEFSVILTKHTFLKHALVAYFSCLELAMKFIFLRDSVSESRSKEIIESQECRECMNEDFKMQKGKLFNEKSINAFQENLNKKDNTYKYLRDLYNYYKHNGYIDFGVREANNLPALKTIVIAEKEKDGALGICSKQYEPHKIEDYEKCINGLCLYHDAFVKFFSVQIEKTMPKTIVDFAKNQY